MIMAWVPLDRWGRHKSTRVCVCEKFWMHLCCLTDSPSCLQPSELLLFYTLWSCCCTCPSVVLVLIELALAHTHSHTQTHTYTPKLWSINNTVTGLYSLTSTDAVCRKVPCGMKVLISVASLFSRCAILAASQTNHLGSHFARPTSAADDCVLLDLPPSEELKAPRKQ